MQCIICIYMGCVVEVFDRACPSALSYVWEKGGAVLNVGSTPRMRLEGDGTLHISQTWSGDIGTYTCRVTSVGGERLAQRPHPSQVHSLQLPLSMFVH